MRRKDLGWKPFFYCFSHLESYFVIIALISYVLVGLPGRGGGEHLARRAPADRDGDGHNNERLPAHGNRPSARETGRGTASPAWDRRARHPSGGDEGAVTGTAAPKTRLRPQGSREEPVRIPILNKS